MGYYRRGDVVFINIPFKIGSNVQGGNRPWVIVQNDIGNFHSPTTLLCPMTHKLKRLDLPTHAIVYGMNGSKPSMVLCEQVRVMDVSPDWKYATTLSKADMNKIDRSLWYAFFQGSGLVFTNRR